MSGLGIDLRVHPVDVIPLDQRQRRRRVEALHDHEMIAPEQSSDVTNGPLL
jgi:hypothetical protein